MITRPNWSQTAAGAGLFLAGVVSAHTWLAVGGAGAQDSKTSPAAPQAFLAGDERTEPVIREILVTLKRVDKRLENIEKTVVTKGAADDAASKSRSRSR